MPARLAHLEFLHQRVLLGPYPAGVRASAEPAARCAARSGRDGVLEIAVDGAHHDVTFCTGWPRRHALQSAGVFEALPWKVQ